MDNNNNKVSSALLQRRELQAGEFTRVERLFRENKYFNFTTGERIESVEDVAYIFRQLETASVENSFAVFVKDGVPTVLHLGIGTFDQVLVNNRAFKLAFDRIQPEQTYFVHNHPSGNLRPSILDRKAADQLETAIGTDIVNIIINTTSGKYTIFTSDSTLDAEMNERPEASNEVGTYSFDTQVFSEDYDPSNDKIRDSRAIAAFISSHRLGLRGKINALILNNNLGVVGNILLDKNKIEMKDVPELAKKLFDDTITFGGFSVVLYGSGLNKSQERAINELSSELRKSEVRVTDVVSILKSTDSYLSFSDAGILRDEPAEYSSSASAILGEEDYTALYKMRGRPIKSTKEAREFLEGIGYKAGLSSLITGRNGEKFVKYKANGVVTPNIVLGKTTPYDVMYQFLLYGNVHDLNIPQVVREQFEAERQEQREVHKSIELDTIEQIKRRLRAEHIAFANVTDSERGYRIAFNHAKTANGNYINYFDVADMEALEDYMDYIRKKSIDVRKQFTKSGAAELQLELDFDNVFEEELPVNKSDIQGLERYSEEEIKKLITEHIFGLTDYNLPQGDEQGEFAVVDMAIHGSRGRGDAKKNSDLDVVVEYMGDYKEDAVFNLLNEDKLEIDGIKVDINPIRREQTGTLSQYMVRSAIYDEIKKLENTPKDNFAMVNMHTTIDAFKTGDASAISLAKELFEKYRRHYIENSMTKGVDLGHMAALVLGSNAGVIERAKARHAENPKEKWMLDQIETENNIDSKIFAEYGAIALEDKENIYKGDHIYIPNNAVGTIGLVESIDGDNIVIYRPYEYGEPSDNLKTTRMQDLRLSSKIMVFRNTKQFEQKVAARIAQLSRYPEGMSTDQLHGLQTRSREAVNYLRNYPDHFVSITESDNATINAGGKIVNIGPAVQLMFKNPSTDLISYQTIYGDKDKITHWLFDFVDVNKLLAQIRQQPEQTDNEISGFAQFLKDNNLDKDEAVTKAIELLAEATEERRAFKQPKEWLPKVEQASKMLAERFIDNTELGKGFWSSAAAYGVQFSGIVFGRAHDLYFDYQVKLKYQTERFAVPTQSEKIDDWGEKIAGARKDMMKEISASIDGITKEALKDNAISKIWKRPDYAKMVEKGEMTTEDALVMESITRAILSVPKPRFTTRASLQARKLAEWTEGITKSFGLLKQYAEATEQGKEIVRKHLREGITRASVTYNVLKELGYPAVRIERFTIPDIHERINADRSVVYSGPNLFRVSKEAAKADTVRYVKTALGFDDLPYTPNDFYVRPEYKPTVFETGRYVVRTYISTFHHRENTFASEAEAMEYSARQEQLGHTTHIEPEKQWRHDVTGYTLRVKDSFKRDTHPVSDIVFATEAELNEYVINNLPELEAKANEIISAKYSTENKTTAADRLNLFIEYDRENGKPGFAVYLGMDKVTARGNLVKLAFFEEWKDAKKWADEHREGIATRLAEMNKQHRNGTEFRPAQPRVGEDYRGGRDITVDELGTTFGFRGIQFGNWTNQEDRQRAINEAYDGLMDMSKVLGVSPKALSLGGELAMAFGARGVGGFSAHYERMERVINLTKTQGAGSLAHEWWHAIDNYFGRHGWSDDTAMATDTWRNGENQLRDEVQQAINGFVGNINNSEYFKRCQFSDYWGSTVELTARYFAEYMKQKIETKGEHNDFLSHSITSEENYRKNMYNFYKSVTAPEKQMTFEEFKNHPQSLYRYAYPTQSEMERINPSLDNLFATLNEKIENDKTILYDQHEEEEITPERKRLGEVAVEMLRKAGLNVVLDREQMFHAMNGNETLQKMTVFHGSPYSFDKFDHQYMDKGEGAQSHGWGTYVAVNRNVGEAYARMATGVRYVGSQSKLQGFEIILMTDLLYQLSYYNKKHDEPLAVTLENIKKWTPETSGESQYLIDFAKQFTAEDFVTDSKNLYEVDIPEKGLYLEEGRIVTKSILERVMKQAEAEGLDADFILQQKEVVERHGGARVNDYHFRGADLYDTIKVFYQARAIDDPNYSSAQEASKFLERAGFKGIHYNGQVDGECYVIFNEDDLTIRNHTQYMKTTGDEVYGFVKNNTIYLDPEVLNANTAIHEYTHLWTRALRQTNPVLWEHGKQLLKETPFWSDVKNDPNYSDITHDDNLVASEVLARLSGRDGEYLLNDMATYYKKKGIMSEMDTDNFIERIKRLVEMAWRYIKDTFLPWTETEASKISLREFVEMPIKDLLCGVNPLQQKPEETILRDIEYQEAVNNGDIEKAKEMLSEDYVSKLFYQIDNGEDGTPHTIEGQKGTNIHANRSAKIIKNLENMANEYDRMPSNTKYFLTNIAIALGEDVKKHSDYVDFDLPNGEKLTIRTSGHNINVNNNFNHGNDNLISIVISRRRNHGLKGNAVNGLKTIEFFYTDTQINSSSEKPLASILRDVANSIKSGEYANTFPAKYINSVVVDKNGIYHKLIETSEQYTSRISNEKLGKHLAILYDQYGNLVPLSERFTNDDELIEYHIGAKKREQYERLLDRKQPDMPKQLRKQALDCLESLEDNRENNKKVKIAITWLANGRIRLPEDVSKVDDAISVAEKAKIDPMSYAGPMELLNAHKEYKPTRAPLDPDNMPGLYNKIELPHGVTIYDVADTMAARESMRQIIDTHFGEDCNPWCVLQGNGHGWLTEDSQDYWDRYDLVQRMVAFQDGHLIAFRASDESVSESEVRQQIVEELAEEYGIKLTLDDFSNTITWDVPMFGEEDIPAMADRLGIDNHDFDYEEYTSNPDYVFNFNGLKQEVEMALVDIMEARFDNIPEDEAMEYLNKETWWDRQDESHVGIPIKIRSEKIENAEGVGELYLTGRVVEPNTLEVGSRSNGRFMEYSRKGDEYALTEESHWKDGKRDGLSVRYNNFGRTIFYGNYVAGKQVGFHINSSVPSFPSLEMFDNDGNLQWKESYKRDFRGMGSRTVALPDLDGEIIAYFNDDKEVSQYKLEYFDAAEDKKHSEYINYSLTTGDGPRRYVSQVSSYVNGMETSEISFFENGWVKEQKQFAYKGLSMSQKNWYPDGQQKFSLEVTNHKEGNLRMEVYKWNEAGEVQYHIDVTGSPSLIAQLRRECLSGIDKNTTNIITKEFDPNNHGEAVPHINAETWGHIGQYKGLADYHSEGLEQLNKIQGIKYHKGMEENITKGDQQRAVTQDLIERLRSMGIDVQLYTNDSMAQNNVSGQQSHVFTDNSQRVYGFTAGGKIYLNQDTLNPETPIHEYTHLWAEALRMKQPEEWNQVVEMMKTERRLWSRVQRDYPQLTSDDEVAEEVLAHYSGKRGSERFAQQYGADVDAGIIDKIFQAIEKFWKAVAEMFMTPWEKERQNNIYAVPDNYLADKESLADSILVDFLMGNNPAELTQEKLYEQASNDRVVNVPRVVYEALKDTLGEDAADKLSVALPFLEYTPREMNIGFPYDVKETPWSFRVQDYTTDYARQAAIIDAIHPSDDLQQLAEDSSKYAILDYLSRGGSLYNMAGEEYLWNLPEEIGNKFVEAEHILWEIQDFPSAYEDRQELIAEFNKLWKDYEKSLCDYLGVENIYEVGDRKDAFKASFKELDRRFRETVSEYNAVMAELPDSVYNRYASEEVHFHKQNVREDNINEVDWNGKLNVFSSSPYLPVRNLSHKVKEGNAEALDKAAGIMSVLVKRIPDYRNAVLVPIPNRSGHAEYTLELASKIANTVGVGFYDILTGVPHEPLYQEKAENGMDGLQLMQFDVQEGLPLPDRHVILIDNVMDTGTTAMSAMRTFGKDCSLVVLGNTTNYRRYNYPVSVKVMPVLNINFTKEESDRQKEALVNRFERLARLTGKDVDVEKLFKKDRFQNWDDVLKASEKGVERIVYDNQAAADDIDDIRTYARKITERIFKEDAASRLNKDVLAALGETEINLTDLKRPNGNTVSVRLSDKRGIDYTDRSWSQLFEGMQSLPNKDYDSLVGQVVNEVNKRLLSTHFSETDGRDIIGRMNFSTPLATTDGGQLTAGCYKLSANEEGALVISVASEYSDFVSKNEKVMDIDNFIASDQAQILAEVMKTQNLTSLQTIFADNYIVGDKIELIQEDVKASLQQVRPAEEKTISPAEQTIKGFAEELKAFGSGNELEWRSDPEYIQRLYDSKYPLNVKEAFMDMAITNAFYADRMTSFDDLVSHPTIELLARFDKTLSDDFIYQDKVYVATEDGKLYSAVEDADNYYEFVKFDKEFPTVFDVELDICQRREAVFEVFASQLQEIDDKILHRSDLSRLEEAREDVALARERNNELIQTIKERKDTYLTQFINNKNQDSMEENVEKKLDEQPVEQPQQAVKPKKSRWEGYDYSKHKFPEGVTVEKANVFKRETPEGLRYSVSAIINGKRRTEQLYYNDVNAFFEKDENGAMTRRVTAEVLAAKYFAKDFMPKEEVTEPAAVEQPVEQPKQQEEKVQTPKEIGEYAIPVYALGYFANGEEALEGMSEEDKQAILDFEKGLPKPYTVDIPDNIDEVKAHLPFPAFGQAAECVMVKFHQLEEQFEEAVRDERHEDYHEEQTAEHTQEEEAEKQAAAAKEQAEKDEAARKEEQRKQEEARKEEEMKEKEAEEQKPQPKIQAVLLATALAAALAKDGIWLNENGKKHPQMHGGNAVISPFNALAMALNSDQKGYKTNVYTNFGTAKAEGFSVRSKQEALPFNWYDWNKYTNKYNSSDVIDKATYEALPAEEKELYRSSKTLKIQNVFNIDQTLMKHQKGDMYKGYVEQQAAPVADSREKQIEVEKAKVDSYKDLEKGRPDTIILLRDGDFYQAYGKSAEEIGKLLDLSVTDMASVQEADGKPMKLVSFPAHQLDEYLPKIVRSGSKVAISDQIENPALKQLGEEGAIYAKMEELAKALVTVDGGIAQTNLSETRFEDGKLSITLNRKAEPGQEMTTALGRLNDLYRAAVSWTGTEERLGRQTRQNMLPEDAAKYDRLVQELAAGALMLRQGLPARISSDNIALSEYWQRELREDPSILTRIERDVNNAVKVLSDIQHGKAQDIDYSQMRGDKMKTVNQTDYTITSEISSHANLEEKTIVLVKHPESKAVDVILPQGASLKEGEDISGMNKNRIIIALTKEGYDGQKIKFYNAGGALGLTQPNEYYKDKEVEIARLKQYQLLTVSKIDVPATLVKLNDIQFRNVQMIRDDNNRWALYVAPAKGQGEAFAVYPEDRDTKRFFEAVKKEGSMNTVVQEIGKKYFNLVKQHPALKADFLMPKIEDADILNRITRVNITQDKNNERSIVMWAEIDGKVQAPRELTQTQYQRFFLVPDQEAYKLGLAAEMFKDKLIAVVPVEQQAVQQPVEQPQEEELEEQAEVQFEEEETAQRSHGRGM